MEKPSTLPRVKVAWGEGSSEGCGIMVEAAHVVLALVEPT